jgi:uncharacterized Tic20 family protein
MTDYYDESPLEPKKKKKKSNSDDRMLAMFCHLGGVFGGFLLPLIIWLVKKDESSYIDYHGKEALNFQLTMLIGHLIMLPLAFCTFGITALAMFAFVITFSIIAATAANRGERYAYPMTIRFIS